MKLNDSLRKNDRCLAEGIIPDAAGTNNVALTITESPASRTPFLMIHCDDNEIILTNIE